MWQPLSYCNGSTVTVPSFPSLRTANGLIYKNLKLKIALGNWRGRGFWGSGLHYSQKNVAAVANKGWELADDPCCARHDSLPGHHSVLLITVITPKWVFKNCAVTKLDSELTSFVIGWLHITKKSCRGWRSWHAFALASKTGSLQHQHDTSKPDVRGHFYMHGCDQKRRVYWLNCGCLAQSRWSQEPINVQNQRLLIFLYSGSNAPRYQKFVTRAYSFWAWASRRTTRHCGSYLSSSWDCPEI